MWKICIDTGGTFTDCVAFSPEGEYKRLKILSSGCLKGTILKQINPTTLEVDFQWNIESDIFNGFSISSEDSNNPSSIKSIDLQEKIITLKAPAHFKAGDFQITSGEEVPVLATRILTSTGLNQSFPIIDMRLGSTRGTNALLERKGAKVVFITTKGFKDLIKIGTQQRPDLFAINIIKSEPLYHQVFEIEERLDKNGDVIKPLRNESLKNLMANLKTYSSDVSIAIALLNSYRNPEHEIKLSKALKKNGFKNITCSSSISKNIKILSRAETTIANAYLLPVIQEYIHGIKSKINEGFIRVMTSAGALVNSENFTPKDSLLSGPAGGIVGAKSIAEKSGFNKIITFDMGGTSTDVAIYNGAYDYNYETKVGDTTILSPGLAIETIAAGGGSICMAKDDLLQVGPESAGSEPGPACYGNGGPLTLTDINLLCGRLVAKNFSIPLNKEKSRAAAKSNNEDILNSFLHIANEKMAEAIKKISIRKGHDPKEYALVTFGGAGGQHACAIAELLNIQNIIIPYEAGLLSAYGISQAEVEFFSDKQVLQSLNNALPELNQYWEQMYSEAKSSLVKQGFNVESIYTKEKMAYLRFKGQENTVKVKVGDNTRYKDIFKENYKKIYGHWLEHQEIEIESIKLIAAVRENSYDEKREKSTRYFPKANSKQKSLTNTGWQDIAVYYWEELKPGAEIMGAAIIASANCTIYLEHGWVFNLDAFNNAIIKKSDKKSVSSLQTPEEADLELFKNRYTGIVEKMGEQLRRTAFSVNVKERLDFSCALLDRHGDLIVNAPHIPVHLGSMGLCLRKVLEQLSLSEGDVVITNHPAFGGSHLPDITLMSGVFYDGQLVGYVANRAHHSEIGGKTPGSMPTDATRLDEEGVIIEPQYLAKSGEFRWKTIQSVFENARYPTRSVRENLADLKGGVASLQTGIMELHRLCEKYGNKAVVDHMVTLKDYVSKKLRESIKKQYRKKSSALEHLDDGSVIQVNIDLQSGYAVFDFTGTSDVHPGNLNATEAIVNSVLLYVLRLLVEEDIPLNEGLLKNVKLILPHGMLNPDFRNLNPMPAVVGGNTEVSQRLTDTILKALELCACSQGTMNNVLFGNDNFGYYETIGGGTGAGDGFNGTDAIHQHMTNTRITDPEIMEYRYPVRLEKFEIRRGSGGQGKWHGGNGIIRQIRFLENLQITILSQHRKEAPYGLKDGEAGKTGKQQIDSKNGQRSLAGMDSYNAYPGDVLTIYTPGGGGYRKG